MSKEMEINGKKYIELDVYNELKKQIKSPPESIKFISAGYTDPACVMALGSVEVSPNYFKVNLSLSYLEKALKIVKQLDKDTVHICMAKDSPICIGNYDEDKNICSGVVLAPRYDAD
jgi:hypothetical protein